MYRSFIDVWPNSCHTTDRKSVVKLATKANKYTAEKYELKDRHANTENDCFVSESHLRNK